MTKFFTPAEAERTLPLVKRIVADILRVGGELRQLVEASSGADLPASARETETKLVELMRELEHIGCSYRDWSFDMGLVDFPARIDGREVLLCWRSDEEHVTWYHLPEAGYAGRTAIPDVERT